jgi:hypothetical protein
MTRMPYREFDYGLNRWVRPRPRKVWKSDDGDDDLTATLADLMAAGSDGNISRADALYWLQHTKKGHEYLARLAARRDEEDDDENDDDEIDRYRPDDLTAAERQEAADRDYEMADEPAATVELRAPNKGKIMSRIDSLRAIVKSHGGARPLFLAIAKRGSAEGISADELTVLATDDAAPSPTSTATPARRRPASSGPRPPSAKPGC